MSAVEIVIPVGWAAFWAYWLAAAFRTKGSRRRSASGAPLRTGIIVVVVLLARIGLLRGHGGVHSWWLQGVGLGLFAGGLGIAVWARVHLGRNWGTPMSERADPELVTSGPYHWVRHPIYSGLILGLLGSALALRIELLVVAMLVGAYFAYSATVEERNMMQAFPEAYPLYRRSTKMLIPFVF